MRTFWFHGGVHPDGHKNLAASKPTRPLAAPELLSIPLSQHIGAPASPVVKAGDHVLAWQEIAAPGGFVSASIHSPVSGKVKKLAPIPTLAGKMANGILIENDGENRRAESEAVGEDASPERLLEAVSKAGIVGMGGAAFPTNVKLAPPPQFTIDTVILNGAECEPYLTADHRLMLECPDQVVGGLRIIMQILNVKHGYIGIEKNKPDALTVIGRLLKSEPDVQVVPLRVRYPQGAEKQLIYTITKRTVPAGALPMAVNCVVHNVATAVAIYRAVTTGEPLVRRLATVTGLGIREPANVEIFMGTPLSHIVEACGGLTDETRKVVAGGPMMGLAQSTLDAPATKATNGILALVERDVAKRPEGPCIRCGSCVEACPMGLSPTVIVGAAKNGKTELAKSVGVTDCIECGSCNYVCPSSIPLVQYIRQGKADVMAAKR